MKKSDLLARFDGPIVMIGFGSPTLIAADGSKRVLIRRAA